MKVTVRSDKVIIDGYVNAVDRFSRPLFDTRIGRFIEKILPNVFKRAIQKASNIDVLLNHKEDRKLASTADGTAKIYEDNVGLRAVVEITDAEVIEKARAGKLRGWSFGFQDEDSDQTTNKDGLIERVVKALTLFEVSIIDDRAMPAYFGTSIETRTVGDNAVEVRTSTDTEIETETIKPTKKENTNRTDSANEDEDDPDEQAQKAQLEADALARENAIRKASI